MTLTFEINLRSYFPSLFFLNEEMADINMSLEYQVDHKKFGERTENLAFFVMENFHSIKFILFPFLVLLLFLDIIKQFNAISSVIIT